MADAYRGLTVEIGGDTSKLTAALHAATKAGAETQRQLRSVNGALKLDPGSLTGAAEKMRLLQDRAQEAGSRLTTLREAMRQLASTKAEGSTKSVAELADQTENAALNAQLALKRYNALDAELERLYAPINKAARATEDFGDEWKKLHDGRAFRLQDAFQLDDAQLDGVISKLRELGIITDDDVDKIRFMKGAWQEAFNENAAAKQVAALSQLRNDIEATTAQTADLSAQMARLKAPSDISKGFADQAKAVAVIDSAVERLTADLKRCDEALRLDPSNTEVAARKMSDLQQASELAYRKAELLQGALVDYKANGAEEIVKALGNVSVEAAEAEASWTRLNSELQTAKGHLMDAESRMKAVSNSVEATDAEYEQCAQAVAKARSEVERLSTSEAEAAARRDKASMAAEYDELSGKIAEARAQAAGFAEQMSDAGGKSLITFSTLKTMGMTLSATLTPVMQQVGQYALDAATSVDSAYRDMRKTVNGTEQDFENLKQAAIDFSNTHVTSADQMLSIQAIGGELGVATDALDTFAQTVSNLDVATDLNTEDAATALGQLSNIMGDLSETQMPNFADALVRLGNNGASTESQIVDIAKRIGSMGSIVGMSTPDVLAWASAIASTGQNSEAAGTAISNTMSDIETAVSAGGDSLDAFAKVAQMSAEGFASTWKNDPTAAMKAFIEGLNEVERSGGSADAVLGELGIKGTRQKQAIMGLMQTIGGLNDNLTMSRDAWNGVSDQWGEAGDAANEANKKAEGLSGSLSRIQNAAQNMSSSMGDALAPVFSDMADKAGDLAGEFDKLDDGQKRAAAAAAVLAGAAGPALSIFSTVGEAMSGASKAMAANATAWAKQASGSKKVAQAMQLASKGTGTFAGALSGLTAKQKLAATASSLATGAMGAFSAALPVAAVGLAVGVIGLLVQKYAEAQAEQQLLTDATKTFSDVSAEAKGSADSQAESIANIADEVRQTTQEIADMNDAARDTFGSLYTDQATLDDYVSTIEQLAGKSGLTATEQEKLKIAVQGYNDITGQSVEITDAQNGKLSVSTEELRKNAQAWKDNAEAQAWQDVAKDTAKKRIEAEKDLAKARDTLTEKTEAYNKAQQKYESYTGSDATKKNQLAMETNFYKNELDAAQKTVNEASNNFVTLSRDMDQAAVSSAILSSNLDANLKEALKNLPANIQGAGLEIANALSAGISEGKVSVDQAVEFIRTGIGTKISQMPAELQPLGIAAAQAVAGGLSAGTIDVQTASAIMSAAATGNVGALPAVFSSYGLQMPANLAAAIQMNAGLPADATQGMKDAVVLTLTGGDVAQAAAMLGRDIDQGLANAIRDNDTEVLNNTYKLSQDVIDKARKTLGVASPSTVFAGIGSDVVAGFAQGISGNGSATSAASSMASNARDAAARVDFYSAGATAGRSFLNGVERFVNDALNFARSAASNIISLITGAKSTAGGGGVGGGGGSTFSLRPPARAISARPMMAAMAAVPAASGAYAARAAVDAVTETAYARAAVTPRTAKKTARRGGGEKQVPQTVITNNNFEAHVITPGEDLYVAAPIMYQRMKREARLAAR